VAVGEIVQESSLLTCASRIFARRLQNIDELTCQVDLLQEEVACFLDGPQLVEYIKNSGGSIMAIKDKFTDKGFQKFIFNFYNQFEMLHDSDRQITFQQLSAELEEFKYDLCFNLDQDNIGPDGSAAENPVDEPEWNICSLGLRKELPQFVREETYKYDFFKFKFQEVDMTSTRMPRPSIPRTVAHLIPARHRFFRHPISKVEADFLSAGTGPIYEGDTLTEQFFFLLIAMIRSSIFGRHHEVVAIGIHLLCNTHYTTSRETIWFQLHIWGNLATTFASLHLDPALVASCLDTMKKFKRNLLSDRIDASLYEQKVYSYIGNTGRQRSIYLELCQIIPSASIFSKLSLDSHVYSCKRSIEDTLALAFCYHKVLELMLLKDTCTLGFSKIRLLQREIHHFLSRPLLNEYWKEQLELTLEMIALLGLAFSKLLHPVCDKRNRKVFAIGLKLNNCGHHLDYFLSLFRRSITFEKYLEIMKDQKTLVEKEQRSLHYESWGIICFQHFLFLSILTNRGATEGKNKLDQAISVFETVGNKERLKIAKLCQTLAGYFGYNNQHKELISQFVSAQSRVLVGVESAIENFNVVKLLSQDPIVGELVKFGVESCRDFDI